MKSAKLKFAFLLISILGTSFFGYGFLKVRKLLDNKSLCSHPPVEKLFKDGDSSSCWLKTKPKKIVIIVIDALRIDFALPFADDSIQDGVGGKFDKNKGNPAYNQLTVLSEISSSNPLASNLFHFIADPPTATTQRLSGISSGSLPAFVEIAQSFSGLQHTTDNFINQMLAGRPSSGHSFYDKFCPLEDGRKRNRFHFFGDDTWLSLFPNLKKESHCQHTLSKVKGSHSFHLFDLDSVDNDIKENIFPLLKELDPLKSNEIILAHFLGFDHCGHKYGPLHKKCGDKLQEMDSVLRDVISSLSALSSDSHLLVFGDHGLTDQGDHGGISPKEVGSLLFSLPIHVSSNSSNGNGGSGNGIIIDNNNSNISTKINTKKDEEFWKSFFKVVETDRSKGLMRDGISDRNFFSAHIPPNFSGSVPQINLASTISLLAGVPIPFVNIGSIIPEILLDLSLYSDDDKSDNDDNDNNNGGGRIKNMKLLLEGIRLNCHQVATFIKESIKKNQNGFTMDSFFINWFERLSYLEDRVLFIGDDDTDVDSTAKEVQHYQMMFHEYHNLILDNITHTRVIWADFNPLLMVAGIAIGVLSLLIYAALSYLKIAAANKTLLVFGFIIFSYFTSLGGTSFITFEAGIVKFLFLTLIGWCVIGASGCNTKITQSNITKFIFISLLLSIGDTLGVCREEQYPHCTTFEVDKNILPFLYLLPLLTFYVFIGSYSLLLFLQTLLFSTFLFISWLERDSFAWLTIILAFSTGIVGFVFLKKTKRISGSGGSNFSRTFSISILLSIFQRHPQGIYLTCGVPLILDLTTSLVRSSNNRQLLPIIAYLLGITFFFSSGHQFTLTSLQWEQAFVVYRGKGQLIPAISVLLNTFAGPLICGLWLGGFYNSCRNDGGTDVSVAHDHSTNSTNSTKSEELFFLASLQTVLLEIFCSFLMRHLMVWRLFTPRLLFQIAIMLTYFICLLCTTS